MVLDSEYPICEFDTGRDPLIRPTDFLAKTLPEKCVITFFRRELEELVRENQLPVLDRLHSEVLDIPVYGYPLASETIAVTMPFCTAPGAASTIEELHAMGCGRFLVCGGAGALRGELSLGEIVVPTAAVRDEGTTYHYLPPAREVECHPEAVACLLSGLERMGLPFTTGKTWTTDAIYRETPDLIRRRRQEGCVTVEMEAAAFFAVSKYYDIPLAQLLYAGDDVSGEAWDARGWDRQKNVRANLIQTAIDLIRDF